LGLTGISQNELDTAPKFSEFKELLQEKLGSAIIVGHNVGFDTKFLESSGLKFSGQIIDTLDLVQWLLPTHHSYNLENLMHTFSISHKEAHRALADSKATLLLLEKLLGVYNGFDAKLKSAIGKLIKGSNFTWVELLENSLPDISFAKAAKKTESKKFKSQTKKNNSLSANMIYDFGMDDNFVRETAMLAQKQGNALLVVPKARQVLELYKDGLVDAAVFSPEVSFDEKKFLVTLKKKVTTPEEVKFLLKILVWYHTNWQTETITDLNLSFFGGQFKSLITGGKIIEHKNSGVAVCDMEVFLFLAENGLYAKRLAVVCGLNEFENTIVSNVGTKTSWGYLNYLLKSYYNSETETGDLKYKSAVESALVASDLFFGLTSALLQSDPPGFMYFKITPQTENDERYVKIKGAGVSFAEKIAEANKVLKSKDLIRFLENITSFFEEAENR
ncbi:MAG: 3'-5' exonuclease, partial [Patescibacteria group bacterium]